MTHGREIFLRFGILSAFDAERAGVIREQFTGGRERRIIAGP
jgi:hypothetical protein